MKKAKECSAKGDSEEGEDCHKEVVARDTPVVREVRLFIKVIKVLTTKEIAIRTRSSWSSGHIGHLVSEARVFMEL